MTGMTLRQSLDDGRRRRAVRLLASLATAWYVSGAMAPLAAQAQPPAPARDRALEAARAIVQTARFATLSTVSADGAPRARIVDPAPPDERFTVWVATNPRSRKVEDVRASRRVTLLYFNAGGGEYVLLEGAATLVTDPDERAAHWRDAWTAFYPGGARGPNVVLVRIEATRLEVVSPARGFDTDPVTWRPFAVDLRR